MGQCSTLPAEGRQASSNSVTSTRYEAANFEETSNIRKEQKSRLKEEGRKESLDFNKLVTPERMVHNEAPKQQAMKRSASPSSRRDTLAGTQEPQSRDPTDQNITEYNTGVEPMDIDSREEAPISLPQPPEAAVRTRCYKLNLESPIVGLSSSQKQHLWLGPYNDPPPPLTYSSSDDSLEGVNETSIAIRTAQIFRGITVSRDGTILTQNARATRSNRGNKTKRGEKSRQAAKIDKAKDLVEETIATGKAPDSEDAAHMVSLVVVGEYDDMKHLVRDGSKKLRDAGDLPDEALLSINRPRVLPSRSKLSSNGSSGLITSKSRASPSLVNSQRTAALQNPEKIQVAALGQASPPRIKSHPRDNRSGRRDDRAGARMQMRLDSCHPGGATGDGDWSNAFNIWNCGGAGTVSPPQPSSPKDMPVYERRESNYVSTREGTVGNRA